MGTIGGASIVQGGGGSSGGGGGTGDVVGPASSTDNAVARYDSTTGKLLQDSGVTISDVGVVAGASINANQLTGTVDNARIDATTFVKTIFDDTDAAAVRATIGAGTGNGTLAGSTGSVDNAVLRADGTGGVTAQSSGVTISDNGSTLINGSTGVSMAFPLIGGGSTDRPVIDVITSSDAARLFIFGFSPGAYGKSAALTFRATSAFEFSSTGNPGSSPDASLVRSAAGVIRASDGSVGFGKMLAGVLVEANTAGSGSPNVLGVNEAGTVLTNEGATAENYHTLPTAASGYVFTFYCQDTDGIRVTASAGDTIRLAGTASAAAGFVRSSTVGSCITLVAINATEWIGTSIVGTWTVDT